MPITIGCDSCGGKLRVAEAAAGKTVKCPKCNKTIAIPAASAVASMPTAPVPAASVSSTNEPVNNAAQLDGTRSPIDETSSRASPRHGSWTVPIVVGAVLFVLLIGCGGILVVVIGIGGLGFLAKSADAPPMQQVVADKTPDGDIPPAIKLALTKGRSNKFHMAADTFEVLSVDDLLDQFGADKVAANKRYMNQWVIVRGTITDASKPELVWLRRNHLANRGDYGDKNGGMCCTPHPSWDNESRIILNKGIICVVGQVTATRNVDTVDLIIEMKRCLECDR